VGFLFPLALLARQLRRKVACMAQAGDSSSSCAEAFNDGQYEPIFLPRLAKSILRSTFATRGLLHALVVRTIYLDNTVRCKAVLVHRFVGLSLTLRQGLPRSVPLSCFVMAQFHMPSTFRNHSVTRARTYKAKLLQSFTENH
jgi:hypothetical protein